MQTHIKCWRLSKYQDNLENNYFYNPVTYQKLHASVGKKSAFSACESYVIRLYFVSLSLSKKETV